VQVTPVQDPDLRIPLQKLPAVEEPAEDPLGHRLGGSQEAPRPGPGQRSHQNNRTIRGRAMQQGDFGLPTSENRHRQDSRPPAAEVEEEAGSDASEWVNREREEHLAQIAEDEARLAREE